MADEERSRHYSGSLQGKSHWEHDPDRDGSMALSSRFEASLFDCFYRGEVEILVSSRALDKDVLDHASVTHINFQKRCTLGALSSGGF